jgi:hypothetical protein
MSFISSKFWNLEEIFSTSASAAYPKYRHSNTRSLSFENLENRRMLAVGSFERTDGWVTSSANAGAYAPGTEAIDDKPQKFAENLTKSDATATAAAQGGFAFNFVDGVGFIPVRIGGFIVAPCVTAKCGILYTVNGYASVDAPKEDTPMATAGAGFEVC